MKVWLTLFFLLFALAQFFLWLKNFIIPLPGYIFGGICLAIVSNYEKNITTFCNTQIQKLFPHD